MVYADFNWLSDMELIGTLTHEMLRGSEHKENKEE